MGEESPLGALGEVVVFDLDGVIYRGDTFFRFTLNLLRANPAKLTPPLLRVLPAGVGSLVRPRARGAVLGRFVRAAVGHMSLDQYQDAAVAFGRRLAHAEGAVAAAMQAIDSHRRAGATVVVATASEVTLARAYLDGVGLDHVALVGSRILVPAAGFSEHARGANKLAALKVAGYLPPFAQVYTDSATDLPLLAHAAVPVLVNASPQTRARAREYLGTRPRQLEW